MKHEFVQQKAHGDAAVYRVSDGDRSAKFYVDYIDKSVTVNERLETERWLHEAKAYLREEVL